MDELLDLGVVKGEFVLSRWRRRGLVLVGCQVDEVIGMAEVWRFRICWICIMLLCGSLLNDSYAYWAHVGVVQKSSTRALELSSSRRIISSIIC